MAEPSHKSEEVENYLIKEFGYDRRDHIRADKCVPKPIGCGQPATKFRDDVSRAEYRISGLCQKCQDKIFGTGDESQSDES